MLLEVKGLSKNFGGLKAINDLEFSVRKGEILGIIGPNGAGKSTLFNLLTGELTPSAGEIIFEEIPVTGLPTYKLALLGIAMISMGNGPPKNYRLFLNTILRQNYHRF